MLKKESRILFLREFTRQIILNSKPSAGSFDEEEIEIPKEVIKLENYLPGLSHETSSLQQISTETMPSKKRIIQRFPMKMIMPQNIKHSIENPKSIPLIKQYAVPFSQKNIPTLFNPDLNIPLSFELGKLNFLINDPRITIIECPGPEKFIIARTEGRTTLTKLSLNQSEIQGLIEKFSKEAKIPIISGLFKAAVGNLIMTAVISSLVGNRFIITKITPRFIIEQNIKK